MTTQIEYLEEQIRYFKKMAEKAGSEMAQWKHKYIRLLELYKKLKGE